MTTYIKVPKLEAQRIKQLLLEHKAFAHHYRYLIEDAYVLYPVTQAVASLDLPYELVERDVEAKCEQSYKEVLSDVLRAQYRDAEQHAHNIQHLMTLLPSSFDVIGSIAIIELDEQLQHIEQHIGQAILSTNKHIKTVVAEDGIHGGEFRTQQHRYLCGEETFLTLHRENGCWLYVDINAVYFSPRLSTERKRIAQQVQVHEQILVMFSGCAPYPCVFGKCTAAKHIVGVEKNQVGHELGVKNVQKNKLKNVVLHQGDVTQIVPTLGQFDRVVMPLPKSADSFLDVGIPAVRPGGILHYYDFLHAELFDEAKTKIREACTRLGRRADFKTTVRCGQHAPYTFRICVDVVIE